MYRYNFEKTIGEIDCLIKEHEKRENNFTMSVLHTCRDCVEELKRMKDAEEQGLLLRLPCPVGTKVYAIVNECEEMYEPSSWYTTISEESFDLYMIDVFGKEVFLTKEEAESALEEKGGAE